MKKYILLLLISFCFFRIQAQNTWGAIADFGGGQRERMISFSIGSRGYAGTGQDTANQVKKDIWEYDPASNSWTQKADLPGVARRDAIAFSIGSRGYVGTGINSAYSFSGIKQKDFYEYNPLTNTWITKASYPGNFSYGIYFATAFATAAKGYVCCGKRGPSYYSNEVYEYNPATNTWAAKASFPGGDRYGASSFSIDGKGYVGLGVDENYYRNDFYVYDPVVNHWDAIADFTGSSRFDAEGFALSGRGFICFGSDGGYQNDLYEYNPLTDNWVQKADFPASARRSAVAFVIGDYAYAGTGKGLSGVKRSLYRYTPFFWEPEKNIGFENENMITEVYPNPLVQSASICIRSTETISAAMVSVYNENGKLVLHTDALHDDAISISKNDLPAGIYFYQVSAYTIDNTEKTSGGKIIIL